MTNTFFFDGPHRGECRMATTFKVTCPSCEADVTIKSSGLIGKKTDCPKCKYRFTVPDPDAASEPDDFDDAPKAKKKGNPKALVGILLGVLGVGVLAGGGYMMFGGSADDKPKPPPPRTIAGNNLPPKIVTPTAEDKKTTDPKPEETPKTGGGDPQIIDPGATVKTPAVTAPAVVENLRPVEAGKLKDPTNLLPGQSNGVLRVDMDRVRQTPFYSAFFDRQMLGFFQNSMTFDATEIQTVMLAVVGPDREPFVLIRTKTPISERKIIATMDLKPGPSTPIKARGYFSITSNAFVTAVSRMLSTEALLGEAGVPVTAEDKKRWAEKPLGLHLYDSQTLVIGDLAQVERFLEELDPKTGDLPFKTELTPMGDAAAPQAEGTPAPAPAPVPAPRGGGRPGAAPPPAPAPDAAAGEAAPKAFTSIPTYRTIRTELKQMLNRLEANEKNPPAIVYADMVDQQLFSRDLSAFDVAGLIIQRELPNVKIIGMCISQFNKDKLIAQMAFQYISAEDAKTAAEKSLKELLEFGGGYLAYIMQTRIRLFTGGTPIAPNQDRGRGNPRGGNGGGDDGLEDLNVVIPSRIDLAHADKLATVDAEILWNAKRYTDLIQPAIARSATQLKGRMSVLSGETTWHSLAIANGKLAAEKKQSPAGIYPRDSKPDRFGLPWPPEQRTSFMIDLLPYLNKAGLRSTIQEKRLPWYAKEHLPASTAWIPEFLVPYYPQSAWRAHHAYAPEGATLGATNYVAISGLGLDSARFNPNDPVQAKKVGMTGYDFGSKNSDVTDGLSNTIYMIQVPPGLNRPWIAGGGSTVMGVDDTLPNPVTDFVHTTPDGKRGTYALMADGSVRFIPATVDPTVFKAMVTRAGGETITDLDKTLPKIPAPKGMEGELKGSGGSILETIFGVGKKDPKEKVDAAELRVLQGKWKVTYMFSQGKPMSADDMDKYEPTVEIDDNRLTLKLKDEADVAQLIMLLDPKSSPKRMVKRVEGGNPNALELAVYAIEDNRKLKLRVRRQANSANDYPKAVAIPSEGDTDSYAEFIRVKE